MKLFIRICLSLCAAAVFATSANAQYWNPWSGWWGAGYYGSPVYAAPVYTTYYGSYNSGFSSYGGCCATSCCDACSSGCSSGSCGSGSCVGSTSSGSLKPSQDPISDKKSPAYEGETRSREFNSDAVSPRTPATEDALDDRTDQFRSPRPNPGTGTKMFDETVDPARERANQKPPMIDPLDGKALDPIESSPVTPIDEKTFFEDTSKPDNSVSRGRDAVIARTGSLSEVIAPKRLASRSLPATKHAASSSKLADKSYDAKSDSPRPIRWISAPLADGHVQL